MLGGFITFLDVFFGRGDLGKCWANLLDIFVWWFRCAVFFERFLLRCLLQCLRLMFFVGGGVGGFVVVFCTLVVSEVLRCLGGMFFCVTCWLLSGGLLVLYFKRLFWSCFPCMFLWWFSGWFYSHALSFCWKFSIHVLSIKEKEL